MKIEIFKIPLALMVVLSLITGILTGLFRLGYNLPIGKIIINHGAIMAGSFLGTVILIERIVTLKKPWMFFWPLVNVSSVIFFYLQLNQIALICLSIGSLGLFYIFYLINQDHHNLPNQIMWTASLAWLIGNLLLLVYENYAYSILWWMAFLLLTIAGERLELNRFLPIPKHIKSILLLLLFTFLLSCLLPFHFGAEFLAGASMLLISIWFLRFDMIRKSVKLPGTHRFSGIALAFGFFWLGISGILFLANPIYGIPYDALIHSFFIGFIFSMIFAHAPIILPGVTGLSIKPYHPTLYLWLSLLQISLALRITGGLTGLIEMKKFFGFLNGIVIILFFLNLALVVLWKFRLQKKA